MKLLVDANLSPRVATRLREGGHAASHVGDLDLLTASDEAILARAAATALGGVVLGTATAPSRAPRLFVPAKTGLYLPLHYWPPLRGVA